MSYKSQCLAVHDFYYPHIVKMWNQMKRPLTCFQKTLMEKHFKDMQDERKIIEQWGE